MKIDNSKLDFVWNVFEGEVADEQYQIFKGFVPVMVVGGRKFKGSGFLTKIKCFDNGYNNSDVWIAYIYDHNSGKIEKATLKYCVFDDTFIDKWQLMNLSKIVHKFKEAYEKKICLDTLAWCRQLKNSEGCTDEGDISRFAEKVILKNYPSIKPRNYIEVTDIDAADRVHNLIKNYLKRFPKAAPKVISRKAWNYCESKGISEMDGFIEAWSMWTLIYNLPNLEDDSYRLYWEQNHHLIKK